MKNKAWENKFELDNNELSDIIDWCDKNIGRGEHDENVFMLADFWVNFVRRRWEGEPFASTGSKLNLADVSNNEADLDCDYDITAKVPFKSKKRYKMKVISEVAVCPKCG